MWVNTDRHFFLLLLNATFSYSNCPILFVINPVDLANVIAPNTVDIN